VCGPQLNVSKFYKYAKNLKGHLSESTYKSVKTIDLSKKSSTNPSVIIDIDYSNEQALALQYPLNDHSTYYQDPVNRIKGKEFLSVPCICSDLIICPNSTTPTIPLCQKSLVSSVNVKLLIAGEYSKICRLGHVKDKVMSKAIMKYLVSINDSDFEKEDRDDNCPGPNCKFINGSTKYTIDGRDFIVDEMLQFCSIECLYDYMCVKKGTEWDA
jgi:hypothetical protein